ncbi:leucyl/phenylalanyl-tRNA--protein transferase [Natronogracilivirgula saccharolytica]|uniref:Leucyl/phenylalanyl-tRNA--protein transferase n=1 Tax=Natronogracilivirga saccharolytica TaxID=2812953 RepID=A0A8J7RJ21_9BACT|nr:leucyl/phenylalanyl-tRNA--protein transferase [Natronogracilivirga saccharolytica]
MRSDAIKLQKVTEYRKSEGYPANIIPPEILLEGYAQGIFPMARSRDDQKINWYTASRRGIIPIGYFKVSRKVKRLIRKKEYRWAVNEDFRGVMEGCAERESTWISGRLIASFEVLHEMGHAHSVEIFRGDRLVAGLYGATLRSAFFAESMFQREPEMGKIALYHCHERLKGRKFRLWDTQFYTPHLGQFGCLEVDSEDYDKLLERALRFHARFD